MLKVAIEYRAAIDDITADKSVKLRKYELDDEDWTIVEDLIRVLKVCEFVERYRLLLTILSRYIRKLPYSFRKKLSPL